ncbi:hypothetical protein CHS0354_032623 [Potamilus streckersoni]|uniref:Uncharacterized protein n=1 Tax=Potamilus streckersoni TaxID=2493646 RepID=A0AAE0T8L0_9BIVA|nr:hypothetical protein CHS0354_032623 [Potamilus streckersoni]
MLLTNLIFGLLLFIVNVGSHVLIANPAENRLHRFLLHNYQKQVRPSGRNSTKLTVRLGMRLSQLIDVDEKNQIMKTKLWLSQTWFDGRLQWDPAKFGGIRMTHIPSEDLWRPDIVLYNNADGEFVVTLNTKAAVSHNGKIVWEPPTIYKSYCPINVEFFPFDQQECFMKFGSWTYGGDEIDLQHICPSEIETVNEDAGIVILDGIDLRDYHQNMEWDIINVTAWRKNKYYPCCQNDPYPYIMFNVTIRRRTLFYTINLIMPCVAISTMTVLVFYLPSDSGEKITLSISILLALTVFFLLLSDINPPTSIVIPLIGKFLLFTMIVVTMSIFLTVYTLSVHFRSPTTHNMSTWIRNVFTEILPRILCMERPAIRQELAITIGQDNNIEFKEAGSERRANNENLTCTATYKNVDQQTQPLQLLDQESQPKYPDGLMKAMKDVKIITDKLQKDKKEKLEIRDWQYVAMVMDRLFLFIFTTACLFGTLGIYLNAPSLYDPRRALDTSNFRIDCGHAF